MKQNGRNKFFSGDKEGMIYRVGHVHYLADWDMVDCNDDNSCSYGLNVGNIDYCRGWESDTTETHNILFSLADLGAVTSNSNVRVKQFFILDAFSGVNGGIYHSSSYRKYTDDQWEVIRQDIIKQFGTLAEEKAKQIAQATSELSNI
jgi:hypothetical protein